MKLTVSGKTKDFTPELEKKFTSKLSKLSKFIEQKGEREAHVTHHLERHQHKVEIVVNFYDHSMVGEGVDPDLETALCEALEKLEKQVVKLKNRWRDTHRDAKGVRLSKEDWETNGNGAPKIAGAVKQKETRDAKTKVSKPRIYRLNYREDRKPMTLEEALLEIERDAENYVVYQDSARNCLSVLVRRPDGGFDLIES